MKVGDRVMIQYPGHTFHKRIGIITEIFDAVFEGLPLGVLHAIAVDGYSVALATDRFRVLAEEAAE